MRYFPEKQGKGQQRGINLNLTHRCSRSRVRKSNRLVTGCNPNDLDIWTDWCRLGLQFVVYKSAEQEWSFIN